MATNANITVAIVNVLMTAVSLPHPTYSEAASWQQGFGVATRTTVAAAGLQELLMAQGLAKGSWRRQI